MFAQEAVDIMLDGEEKGMTMSRLYFTLKVVCWMVKIGKLMDDKEMVDKYMPWIDKLAKRVNSNELGYDGYSWQNGGWGHFNAAKSMWAAYEATGKKEYLDAYKRGIGIFSIDDEGIYKYGEKLAAPGGFDMYGGAEPISIWGHGAETNKYMKEVDQLINLDVLAGWMNTPDKVKDYFCDGGNGPWECDDGDPDYFGFSLGGLKIPQPKKYMLPIGSFPVYDEKGNVTVTNTPIIDSPQFPHTNEVLQVFEGNNIKVNYNVISKSFKPGDTEEKDYIFENNGKLENSSRVLTSKDKPLVYMFDTPGIKCAGIDMDIIGKKGYKIEVSPDNKRWYRRIETWSDKQRKISMDVSFMTGFSDELQKMFTVEPGLDKEYLVQDTGSTIDRDHYRYVDDPGSFVYKLDLPDLTECHLDFLVGNGYLIEMSSDGQNWTEELNAAKKEVRKDMDQQDAAWVQLVDATKYLGTNKTIYVKVSCLKDKTPYKGKTAFLRRMVVYGVFNSGKVYVRLSSTAPDWFDNSDVVLTNVTFRKW
jgi:hypothetical protein